MADRTIRISSWPFLFLEEQELERLTVELAMALRAQLPPIGMLWRTCPASPLHPCDSDGAPDHSLAKASDGIVTDDRDGCLITLSYSLIQKDAS